MRPEHRLLQATEGPPAAASMQALQAGRTLQRCCNSTAVVTPSGPGPPSALASFLLQVPSALSNAAPPVPSLPSSGPAHPLPCPPFFSWSLLPCPLQPFPFCSCLLQAWPTFDPVYHSSPKSHLPYHVQHFLTQPSANQRPVAHPQSALHRSEPDPQPLVHPRFSAYTCTAPGAAHPLQCLEAAAVPFAVLHVRCGVQGCSIQPAWHCMWRCPFSRPCAAKLFRGI